MDNDEDSVSVHSDGVISALSGAMTPLHDDSDPSEASSDDIENREDSDPDSDEGEPLEGDVLEDRE